jgi:Heavy-metal-associated domain
MDVFYSHRAAGTVKEILAFSCSVIELVTWQPLRSREILVTLRLPIATMRTKTAIISVANLKSDDLPALRAALQAVPGVDSVEFSLERSVAVLEFDPSQSHVDDFLRAVLKAGFKVL